MIRLLLLLFPLSVFSQLDSLKLELEKKQTSVETAQWLINTASRTHGISPESSEFLAKEAVRMSKELDYEEGIATAYFHVGLSFWYRDLHDKAIEYYLKSLAMYEEIGHAQRVAIIKMNIGSSYDEIEQREKAMKFIREATNDFKIMNDTMRYMNGYLNQGVIHTYLKDYDSALYNFELVRDYRLSINDSSRLAIVFMNIAGVYEELNDVNAAINNFRRARIYVNPDEILSSEIDLGLGHCLLLNNQNTEGLSLVNEALRKFEKVDQNRMKQQAFEILKEHYETQGDFKNSFKYQKLEIEQERKWRGDEVLEKVKVLELKYEDEKKARALADLRAEKAKDKMYLSIAIAIGLVLLIGSILLVIIYKLRVKNDKLKEEELKRQIESKNKELTSYALNFIQKNELLNELTEKVNNLKSEAPEKTSKELNQLNNVIKGHMRIDQEWDNFKLMFEEVHQGFLVRLKEAYPELGNSELKLCALLRLNMNLKESSQILGIASDSVKTARSRLRKKLGLATEENLVDFMLKFDADQGRRMSA